MLSNPTTTNTVQLCPSSRVVKQDLDQLPSSVCHDLDPEFNNSLLDHLLMLEEEQQQPQNTNTYQPKHSPVSPYEMPMIVEASHIPMDTCNHAVTTSSYSHHPTPGSTPPSPYSPYNIISIPPTPNATPASTPHSTPSATPSVTPKTNPTTPIMSPHGSKPGSPRGSMRHHYRRQRSNSKTSTMDAATGEKLPRHKRPSHILAEHKRRSKIQVKLLYMRYLIFLTGIEQPPTVAIIHSCINKCYNICFSL